MFITIVVIYFRFDACLYIFFSQGFSKEDTKALNLCKRMMERGECPPLIVEDDKSIKELTIITEYVGDVDFLMNREYDNGDSIMTLLSASNPFQSLVICLDKCSNIARFMNGINNHTEYVSIIFKLYSLHMLES